MSLQTAIKYNQRQNIILPQKGGFFGVDFLNLAFKNPMKWGFLLESEEANMMKRLNIDMDIQTHNLNTEQDTQSEQDIDMEEEQKEIEVQSKPQEPAQKTKTYQEEMAEYHLKQQYFNQKIAQIFGIDPKKVKPIQFLRKLKNKTLSDEEKNQIVNDFLQTLNDEDIGEITHETLPNILTQMASKNDRIETLTLQNDTLKADKELLDDEINKLQQSMPNGDWEQEKAELEKRITDLESQLKESLWSDVGNWGDLSDNQNNINQNNVNQNNVNQNNVNQNEKALLDAEIEKVSGGRFKNYEDIQKAFNKVLQEMRQLIPHEATIIERDIQQPMEISQVMPELETTMEAIKQHLQGRGNRNEPIKLDDIPPQQLQELVEQWKQRNPQSIKTEEDEKAIETIQAKIKEIKALADTKGIDIDVHQLPTQNLKLLMPALQTTFEILKQKLNEHGKPNDPINLSEYSQQELDDFQEELKRFLPQSIKTEEEEKAFEMVQAKVKDINDLVGSNSLISVPQITALTYEDLMPQLEKTLEAIKKNLQSGGQNSANAINLDEIPQEELDTLVKEWIDKNPEKVKTETKPTIDTTRANANQINLIDLTTKQEKTEQMLRGLGIDPKNENLGSWEDVIHPQRIKNAVIQQEFGNTTPQQIKAKMNALERHINQLTNKPPETEISNTSTLPTATDIINAKLMETTNGKFVSLDDLQMKMNALENTRESAINAKAQLEQTAKQEIQRNQKAFKELERRYNLAEKTHHLVKDENIVLKNANDFLQGENLKLSKQVMEMQQETHSLKKFKKRMNTETETEIPDSKKMKQMTNIDPDSRAYKQELIKHPNSQPPITTTIKHPDNFGAGLQMKSEIVGQPPLENESEIILMDENDDTIGVVSERRGSQQLIQSMSGLASDIVNIGADETMASAMNVVPKREKKRRVKKEKK